MDVNFLQISAYQWRKLGQSTTSKPIWTTFGKPAKLRWLATSILAIEPMQQEDNILWEEKYNSTLFDKAHWLHGG